MKTYFTLLALLCLQLIVSAQEMIYEDFDPDYPDAKSMEYVLQNFDPSGVPTGLLYDLSVNWVNPLAYPGTDNADERAVGREAWGGGRPHGEAALRKYVQSRPAAERSGRPPTLVHRSGERMAARRCGAYFCYRIRLQITWTPQRWITICWRRKSDNSTTC